jgi:hypothetical protein
LGSAFCTSVIGTLPIDESMTEATSQIFISRNLAQCLPSARVLLGFVEMRKLLVFWNLKASMSLIWVVDTKAKRSFLLAKLRRKLHARQRLWHPRIPDLRVRPSKWSVRVAPTMPDNVQSSSLSTSSSYSRAPASTPHNTSSLSNRAPIASPNF